MAAEGCVSCLTSSVYFIPSCVLACQSKVDSIQIVFYSLLGARTNQTATGAEFYYLSNLLLEVRCRDVCWIL